MFFEILTFRSSVSAVTSQSSLGSVLQYVVFLFILFFFPPLFVFFAVFFFFLTDKFAQLVKFDFEVKKHPD